MVTVGLGRKYTVRNHSNKSVRHTVNMYAMNSCEKACVRLSAAIKILVL